jgi:hypothetical protein
MMHFRFGIVTRSTSYSHSITLLKRLSRFLGFFLVASYLSCFTTHISRSTVPFILSSKLHIKSEPHLINTKGSLVKLHIYYLL